MEGEDSQVDSLLACIKEIGIIRRVDKMQRKKASSLEKFYSFYSEHFGEEWPSILESLNLPSQHCAVVNKFATQTDVYKKLLTLDVQSLDIPLLSKKTVETELDQLSLNCFFPKEENGNRFPKQGPTSNGYFDYYIMDASSLLPVLILDIQPNSCVLDMCASPGGKSVLISQFLSKDGSLVASEVSNPRKAKLIQVVREYIPKISKTKPLVQVRNLCGSKFGEFEPSTYDRVLVDAPCSTDRHFLSTNFKYSLWSDSQSKAKAKVQKKLLASALQSVAPGGIVVYSTCSLSSFENDGVVDDVLSAFSASGELKVSAVDVKLVGHPLAEMLNSRATKFGTLILPLRTKNWGPMYVCKLQRLTSESQSKSQEEILT